jgi:hypothetical protein
LKKQYSFSNNFIDQQPPLGQLPTNGVILATKLKNHPGEQSVPDSRLPGKRLLPPLAGQTKPSGEHLPMKSSLFAVVLLFTLATTAVADNYTFTLINKTGFEIIDLFFSPAAQKNWGDEVLTVDTIPDKEKLKINVARKERSESWDILVNDEQGVSYQWPNLKLSEISTLVLTIKAGQPIAFYE